MSLFIKTRMTFSWLVLLGITYVSWLLGRGSDVLSAKTAAITVIAAAFLKVRIVIFEFMEIRSAPAVLRRAVDAWALIVCAALCAYYWNS